MSQSKHEIQSLLAEANAEPRHRFGQNFMIDQNLVRLVADAGLIAPGEFVIEVGPGTGTLTGELLARGADVLAVEIDRDLAALLRQRLAGEPRFRLIGGDALASKHDVNDELLAAIVGAKQGGRVVKLVANLPYNIASPLIIELLSAGVDLLAFTVQKEVADRLKGKAGSDDYGVLSVMTQMLAEVEVLRTLPPQAFWPAPKIDSALVRLTRRDRIGGPPRPFNQFLQRLFSGRRKMLRKTMTNAGYDADALLPRVGVDPQSRVEDVPAEKLLELFRAAAAR